MQPAFVVLTDFSSAAERALRYAAQLAHQAHGGLVLMHLYQEPFIESESAMMSMPLVLQNRRQTLADLTERARQLNLPAEAVLSVETLADTVTDVVQRYHPLLLVLGREREVTLLDRLLRQQVAPLLQATRYPLLLVPEGWARDAAPRRIVVAADEHGFWLTPPAALGLRELLTSWPATTTVVHVGPAHGPSQAAVGFEAVRRCGLFGPLDGNALYEVREEEPATGILHAARELRAELVVVLARPHTFLDGLFHRSITAQVLRHSAAPVLVLPTMH